MGRLKGPAAFFQELSILRVGGASGGRSGCAIFISAGSREKLKLTELVESRYSRFSTIGRDFKTKNALSPAVVHILLALAREDLHGYGITLEIARQSNGQYKMGPGTLYDNLKKLMDLKLVIDTPTDGLPIGESRRLYHLTKAGHAALTEEIERLKLVLREARLVLGAGRTRRT